MIKKPWFIDEMKINDPEFYPLIEKILDKALSPKSLDEKTKHLIILALDALKGADQGVKVVAQDARQAGASEEEIRETIRLAYFVSGMNTIKASSQAFQKNDILK